MIWFGDGCVFSVVVVFAVVGCCVLALRFVGWVWLLIVLYTDIRSGMSFGDYLCFVCILLVCVGYCCLLIFGLG